MSRVFWVQDNGRWMVGTSMDFVPPSDRVVEVRTKGQPKKMRLATEPSCESVDRQGNRILLWGKSDLVSTHGRGVRRRGLKGRMS
jgi:hypothetical protein